ncbi:MAG: flagellar protein FlgN [Colwellia sp.]
MSEGSSSLVFLAQQYNQLQTLEKIIADEKEILQQHDPEALIQISQQKNQVLLAIKDLDQQISYNQQFAQDRAAGKLTQELSNIQALLEHCQKQNQINGQIIAQSQLAVERMKTSLLESHNKASITYDNKGKKSARLSSIGLKA